MPQIHILNPDATQDQHVAYALGAAKDRMRAAEADIAEYKQLGWDTLALAASWEANFYHRQIVYLKNVQSGHIQNAG